ncbi:MAG: DUF2764 family protein [Oscillospiraceae bacterium]|nr:DUF2764 family protein [Oscillospiraceae bacterium]
MASYYYLIASLPTLTADGDLPLDYAAFLNMCKSNVSEATYQLLERLTLSSSEGPLVDEWSVFYGNLMRELNYQRSLRLGKPYTRVYEKEPASASVAASAIAAENPLAAERILLDYEFKYLDSLVALHTFDDYVLFGYAIKLKLLERMHCFEHEKGKAEFQRLFEQVQQRVFSL